MAVAEMDDPRLAGVVALLVGAMAKITLGDMMILVAVFLSFAIGGVVLWYTTELPRRFDVMIEPISDAPAKAHPCASDPKRLCLSLYIGG